MEMIGGKTRWIDIAKPQEKELGWLKKTFGFHPIIIEELKETSARAKVEAFDGYLYLIYHFPVYDQSEKVSRRAEIDFLITKNAVVTVHYENIEAFSDFKKSLENPLDREKFLKNGLQLTCGLVGSLINFNQRQLNHIQQKLDYVADKLFSGNDKEILKEISYLKRDLSEYQLIVKPQQHLLNSLLENGAKFWGEQNRIYLADLLGDYLKLMNRLDSYREAVLDFQSTNSQLMNVKTNEVMTTFTILAFSTFPLMLIAAIFSTDAADTPLVGRAGGFWFILGIMAVMTLIMFAYFKRKKWL